jgi:hypothetical protein
VLGLAAVGHAASPSWRDAVAFCARSVNRAHPEGFDAYAFVDSEGKERLSAFGTKSASYEFEKCMRVEQGQDMEVR